MIDHDGAPAGVTERFPASAGVGWMASSTIGPRIMFAPDGEGEGAGGAEPVGGEDSGDAPSAPVSARDAVAAAFDKLQAGEKPDTAARVATGVPEGHQQTDRSRDERGRFAPGQETPSGAKADAQQEQKVLADTNTVGAEQQQAVEKTPGRVPPGWSPASKDAYAGLPQCVKDDIVKREQEVDKGLSELREYRDLRPYREMAQRSGTNLPNVMSALTKFEDTVARNPVEAIGGLSQLYGFNLAQVVAGLAPVAGLSVTTREGGPVAAPEQTQVAPASPQFAQIDPAVLRRLDMLQQHVIGGENAKVEAAIQAFGADPKNEFFENVGDDMMQILQGNLQAYRQVPINQALADVYEKAVWANPDTRAVLIKRQAEQEGRAQAEKMKAAADQARRAAKGSNGAPVNGVTPGSAQPRPKSAREAAAMAYDALT